MFLLIIILLFILFLVFLFNIIFIKKIKIKWQTFIKKGFVPSRGVFGVYCYCGKQGQGKTYSVVEFLKNHKNMKIYSNIKSINGIEYTYFNGFDQLLELRSEHDCIIVYDEIFTALTKSSRINTDVLDFLSQMRKRRIIFLTTAQEWLEINITLRRYCRYQIDCRMLTFFNISTKRKEYVKGLGILVKYFYNAEQMKWSSEENEYIAPIIETTISKCNVEVANSYDTFEQINT